MNEQKAPEQQGCLQRAGRIAGIVVLAIVTIVCFVALVTREPLYRRWAPEEERPVPDARVIEALNGAGDEGAAAGGEETAATEEDPAAAGQNPITTEADPAATEEETMADKPNAHGGRCHLCGDAGGYGRGARAGGAAAAHARA